jgi:serine/threonine protein kinase
MLTFGKSSEYEKRDFSKISKNLTEYRIEGTIGEGNFGKVKLATHLITNRSVAIKFINKNHLIRAGDSDRIYNEMKIISILNHPNILKAYEIFEDDMYYYIVMERPEKGDLFHYICSKGRLTLNEASFIYYQILNGISYLQKQKIAHRDLKPENILLTEDLIVKIGDFGLSKYYKTSNTRLSTICGSPCYSAPEMLRGNKYKPWPIDVWGIGVILYCMVCGALPFEDEKEDILIRKVVQCDYNCPYYVNANVRALFRRIFCSNPNERITMDELKLNFVYNMGKANFLKFFKIFGEDGDLLPQVKRFIKEKTIHYLETECSMEINPDIEKTTTYKIFFHNFMQYTKWELYHIPKNDEENVEQIEKNESINSKSNSNINSNKSLSNKNNNFNKNENIEEDKCDGDLLYIPPHESLSNAINKTYEKNNEFKVNFSKEDIDAMRKLGILSHSFDANWTPKIQYQDNNNYNKEYITSNNNENYIEINNNNLINKPYQMEGQKFESQGGSYGTTGIASHKIFTPNNNN